jgi:hypothetical protein
MGVVGGGGGGGWAATTVARVATARVEKRILGSIYQIYRRKRLERLRFYSPALQSGSDDMFICSRAAGTLRAEVLEGRGDLD